MGGVKVIDKDQKRAICAAQLAFAVAKAVRPSIFVFCLRRELFSGNERTDGPASRHFLGGQTMGRHWLWAAGGRSEAEGHIRYRVFQVMGGRTAGKHARRGVAQCRGFWQGTRRRPQAFSRTAPKNPAAGGARLGPDRNGPERNQLERNGLERKFDRGAETRCSKF